ncbi:hypothetical protein ACEQ6C_37990, partial [Rhizobium ruizarguesonis]
MADYEKWISISARGTRVYVLYTLNSNGAKVRVNFFDAAQTNTNISSGYKTVDSQYNTIAGLDCCVTPDGTKLWWAASTKNSTYPNSFNIRAGSIPILPDGTLGTPSAVEQKSASNVSGTDWSNPTITFVGNSPVILAEYKYNSNNYAIMATGG